MSLADDAISFFTGKGWTKEQAAGIVGNLSYESDGLNPSASGDNGLAYGLGQWHPDRQYTFQRIFGKSIKQSTFQDQLAFVDWELRNTEQYAGYQLKNATSVDAATKTIMQYYERPANSSSLTERIKAASNALTGSPQSVADASVSNGFDWTFGLTNWLNTKLASWGSTIGNSFIGIIAGLAGVLVIGFGLYQLVKDPVDSAKGLGKKAALAAVGA